MVVYNHEASPFYQGPEKQGLRVLLLFTSLSGVLICVYIARKTVDDWRASGPVLLAAFYSLSSLFFTITSGTEGDFFTQFSGTFVCMILALGTVICGVWYCGKRNAHESILGEGEGKFTDDLFVATAAICVFAAMAGFFAFTFSIVMFCIGFAVLGGLMSIMIRCGWGGSHFERPDFYAEERSAIRNIMSSLLAIPVRFLNFVLQVALITYVFGDLWPLIGELWHAKALIKEHLKLLFASIIADLPGVAQILEIGAVVGGFLNDVSGHVSEGMLQFSTIWTQAYAPALISVSIFEMFVILAALIIVLSDVLLIVAPRKGAGFVGRVLGESVSRAFLYLLQVLASASHILVLALVGLKPLERSEAEDTNEMYALVAYPLTYFYWGLTVLVAFIFLMALWSGEDGGMQNGAAMLMEMNGVEMPAVRQNNAVICAFPLAFLGIWPESVLQAFEVSQRAINFKLEEDDILLATVNALSFPLYVVPFGTIVAKLGEYLNQNPIYVAGRGFGFTSPFHILLTLTYVAEYVLVLWTARAAMHSVEAGGPDEAEIEAAAEEAGHSVFMVLVCLLAITVVRLPLLMIRDFNQCRREIQTRSYDAYDEEEEDEEENSEDEGDELDAEQS